MTEKRKDVDNMNDESECLEDAVYFGELDEVMKDGVDIEKIAELLDANLDIVDKIIDNETWLEGEKRGEPVDPNDPAVYDRVCDILSKDAYSIVDASERLANEKKAKLKQKLEQEDGELTSE